MYSKLSESELYDIAYEEVVCQSMETMLTDTNAVGKFVKLRYKEPTVFERIKNWISNFIEKIKAAYKGIKPDSEAGRVFQKTIKDFEKIEDLFAKALNNAIESGGSSKSEIDKFSIREIVDKNGHSYGTGVYLDFGLDNLSENEKKAKVKERIKSLGGKTFTAIDNNGIEHDILIAEMSDKFIDKNGKKRNVNRDLLNKYNKYNNNVKQNAVVLIDELIETARYDNTKQSRYSHDWLDDNGKNAWEYWTTFIQDKNKTVWAATLNIANTANGEKILYDISPIEKGGAGVKSPYTTTKNIIRTNEPKSQGKNKKFSDTEIHFSLRNNVEEKKPVSLSNDNELTRRINGIRGAAKYNIIKEYILEMLGTEVRFSDGLRAVINKSDAQHIAHASADKKTAEIAKIKELIRRAELYAEATEVEHRIFGSFKYYETFVEFNGDVFPIYFNIGRSKSDKKYHLYDITQRIKDTAHRVNDVGRSSGLRPISGIFDKNDTSSFPESQENFSDTEIHFSQRNNSKEKKNSVDKRKKALYNEFETIARIWAGSAPVGNMLVLFDSKKNIHKLIESTEGDGNFIVLSQGSREKMKEDIEYFEWQHERKREPDITNEKRFDGYFLDIGSEKGNDIGNNVFSGYGEERNGNDELSYELLSEDSTNGTGNPTETERNSDINEADSAEAAFSMPENKRSDRNTYSYKDLISKPDMKLTVVNMARQLSRADTIAEAKKNAAQVGTRHTDGSISVNVKDSGKNVIIGTKGLSHSLDRRLKELGPITLKVGEIIKNSIVINELVPKYSNADSTYVMIGVAEDVGNIYIIESIVNTFSNELISMDVLYSLNEKKGQKNSMAVLNAPQVSTPDYHADISIADLLDYVNKYFPDILSEDVLKHYGHNARPEGELGKSALFSSRNTLSKSTKLNDALEEREKKRLSDDVTRLHSLNTLVEKAFKGERIKESTLKNVASLIMKEAGITRGNPKTAEILRPTYETLVGNRKISADEVERLCREAAEKILNISENKAEEEYQVDELALSIYDHYWKLTTLQTYANNVQKEVNALTRRHREEIQKLKEDQADRIKKVKEQEKEERKELILKERERTQKLVQENIDEYKERRENASERHARSQTRQMLKRQINRMESALKRTKKNNVKEELRDVVQQAVKSAKVLFRNEVTDSDIIKATGEDGIATASDEENEYIKQYKQLLKSRDFYIKSIDELTERQPAGYLGSINKYYGKIDYIDSLLSHHAKKLSSVIEGERRRINSAEVNEALGELSDAYGKLKDSDKPYLSRAFNQGVYDRLNALKSILSGTKIIDMTSAQLREVYDSYTAVLTTIKKSNELFAEGKQTDIDEIENTVRNEITSKNRSDKNRMAVTRFLRDFAWADLKPIYAMRNLFSKNYRKAKITS